jgi:hypothetical protein
VKILPVAKPLLPLRLWSHEDSDSVRRRVIIHPSYAHAKIQPAEKLLRLLQHKLLKAEENIVPGIAVPRRNRVSVKILRVKKSFGKSLRRLPKEEESIVPLHVFSFTFLVLNGKKAFGQKYSNVRMAMIVRTAAGNGWQAAVMENGIMEPWRNMLTENPSITERIAVHGSCITDALSLWDCSGVIIATIPPAAIRSMCTQEPRNKTRKMPLSVENCESGAKGDGAAVKTFHRQNWPNLKYKKSDNALQRANSNKLLHMTLMYRKLWFRLSSITNAEHMFPKSPALNARQPSWRAR